MSIIGIVSTLSPFYGSKILGWRAHDRLFRRLLQQHPEVSLVAPMPVGGGQTFADRLYNGDQSVLYPTLRDLRIRFHPMGRYDFDCLYIENIGTYSDTAVGGRIYSESEQRLYLEDLIEDTLVANRPVVFLDMDGWSMDSHKDVDPLYSEVQYFWNKYKSHPKCRLTTNYEREDATVIPFEIDLEDLRPIRPLSQRHRLLAYIGHQYHRLGILPMLEHVASYGLVEVFGQGWRPHREKARNVQFRDRVPVTHDSLHKIYGSSKFGLITYRDCDREQRLRLYLLRWRELAIAGTLILIEDDPFFYEILGSSDYSVYGVPYDFFLRATSDADYEAGVASQRKRLIEQFGVDRWYSTFFNLLFARETVCRQSQTLSSK